MTEMVSGARALGPGAGAKRGRVEVIVNHSPTPRREDWNGLHVSVSPHRMPPYYLLHTRCTTVDSWLLLILNQITTRQKSRMVPGI